MGSPSGRVPEQGPDWFLVATEACDGGTPDLSSVLEVLGYVGIYGGKENVGGASGGPTRQGGAPRGGGRAPHPRGQPGTPLTCTPSPSGWFPSKINFSNCFRSVLTPSDIHFPRNTEIGIKQQIWAGPPVNRLVPKII